MSETLLDAVDELTKPKRAHEVQDIIIDGKIIGTQKVIVEQVPLLEQLDSAIRSTIGGASAKGASLAFEGAVLNTAALFTAMKIASQLRDWCGALGIRPAKDSSKDLRAWYAKTLEKGLDDDVAAYREKVLWQWAGQIRSLLDPPRERELPDACPICGALEWWDPKDGHKYLHPLVVRYRPTGPDMIQQAKALCRSCETVWGVRELAYALETVEEESA